MVHNSSALDDTYSKVSVGSVHAHAAHTCVEKFDEFVDRVCFRSNGANDARLWPQFHLSFNY